ncbi:CoA-binding protein [Aspergillus homomorphus CBS 101889]|uniref:CoA-binding domain-containing protein n=1 Tax=Aspergillus homomorphus (strain CBS 101889) TaxID=1450537 RepID=A0A395ICX5_ASPHC|nr:hypothetical protein BO97DRAFT_381241 [Aspergillus homomorphus CBS 101889]RAL17679.1 hypothetical protein BO97DRAFT_381241 [Aspergillus homomorphus CBS 101889]
MSATMEAVKLFFSSPRFAVAGASNDPAKFGHRILAWYHHHSLPVTPLNPRASSIQLQSTSLPTVASVRDLPAPTETSLSVVTPPAVTLSLLREAYAVGIPAVFLQPGTYDQAVLDYLEGHFAAAVVGAGGRGSEGWMPTSSITLDSPIPPHLDLAGAPSQLFQVPPSPSASSALYRSIAVPPRKRARSSLETRSSWLQVDGSASPLVTSVIGSDDLLHGVDNVVDLDYRPSRYREPSDPLHLDTSVDSLGEAGGLRRKRSHPDPYLIAASPTGSDEKEQSPSVTSYPSAAPVRWSKAVLGVVGKVWDFCWSGAFRGFYAGGGRGYTMSGEQEEEDDDDNSMTFPSLASEKGSAPTTPSAQPPRRGPSTPLPGCYPEETDLQGNWVMVSPPSATIYRGSTPRRGLRRTTTAAHLAARRARPHTRRVLMSHAPPSLPSQHYFSSPAMPRESPVSVNSKRHMAEKRRLEREEDASLQRMEQRLQVLIREGTQALATRVEVMDSEMED